MCDFFTNFGKFINLSEIMLKISVNLSIQKYTQKPSCLVEFSISKQVKLYCKCCTQNPQNGNIWKLPKILPIYELANKSKIRKLPKHKDILWIIYINVNLNLTLLLIFFEDTLPKYSGFSLPFWIWKIIFKTTTFL